MIDKLKTISLAHLRLLLTLLAIAVGMGIAAKQPVTLPDGDGREYVGYARTLYLTGSFAATTASGPPAASSCAGAIDAFVTPLDGSVIGDPWVQDAVEDVDDEVRQGLEAQEQEP